MLHENQKRYTIENKVQCYTLILLYILWLDSSLYAILAVIYCVVTVPLPSLGMVLVRTDAGQLVMVPQQALAQAQMQAQVQTQGQGPASLSPRLSVPTTGPVFRLSTAQVCPA